MSPTRQTIHNLVDIIDKNDIELLYHVLLKFVPGDMPQADEIEALSSTNAVTGNYTSHDAIDWN